VIDAGPDLAFDPPSPEAGPKSLRVVRGGFPTDLGAGSVRSAGPIQGVGEVRVLLMEAVGDVVNSALRRAIKTDTDLNPGARAILIGVLRGTGEKGGASLKILIHAARIAIRQTAALGGDLAAATQGLILGAVAGAKSIGVASETAAAAAARGALEGAAESGFVTVDRVLGALKEPIGGSQVALPEPL
jgi:hypothetical protein